MSAEKDPADPGDAPGTTASPSQPEDEATPAAGPDAVTIADDDDDGDDGQSDSSLDAAARGDSDDSSYDDAADAFQAHPDEDALERVVLDGDDEARTMSPSDMARDEAAGMSVGEKRGRPSPGSPVGQPGEMKRMKVAEGLDASASASSAPPPQQDASPKVPRRSRRAPARFEASMDPKQMDPATIRLAEDSQRYERESVRVKLRSMYENKGINLVEDEDVVPDASMVDQMRLMRAPRAGARPRLQLNVGQKVVAATESVAVLQPFVQVGGAEAFFEQLRRTELPSDESYGTLASPSALVRFAWQNNDALTQLGADAEALWPVTDVFIATGVSTTGAAIQEGTKGGRQPFVVHRMHPDAERRSVLPLLHAFGPPQRAQGWPTEPPPSSDADAAPEAKADGKEKGEADTAPQSSPQQLDATASLALAPAVARYAGLRFADLLLKVHEQLNVRAQAAEEPLGAVGIVADYVSSVLPGDAGDEIKRLFVAQGGAVVRSGPTGKRLASECMSRTSRLLDLAIGGMAEGLRATYAHLSTSDNDREGLHRDFFYGGMHACMAVAAEMVAVADAQDAIGAGTPAKRGKSASRRAVLHRAQTLFTVVILGTPQAGATPEVMPWTFAHAQAPSRYVPAPSVVQLAGSGATAKDFRFADELAVLLDTFRLSPDRSSNTTAMGVASEGSPVDATAADNQMALAHGIQPDAMMVDNAVAEPATDPVAKTLFPASGESPKAAPLAAPSSGPDPPDLGWPAVRSMAASPAAVTPVSRTSVPSSAVQNATAGQDTLDWAEGLWGKAADPDGPAINQRLGSMESAELPYMTYTANVSFSAQAALVKMVRPQDLKGFERPAIDTAAARLRSFRKHSRIDDSVKSAAFALKQAAQGSSPDEAAEARTKLQEVADLRLLRCSPLVELIIDPELREVMSAANPPKDLMLATLPGVLRYIGYVGARCALERSYEAYVFDRISELGLPTALPPSQVPSTSERIANVVLADGSGLSGLSRDEETLATFLPTQVARFVALSTKALQSLGDDEADSARNVDNCLYYGAFHASFLHVKRLFDAAKQLKMRDADPRQNATARFVLGVSSLRAGAVHLLRLLRYRERRDKRAWDHTAHVLVSMDRVRSARFYVVQQEDVAAEDMTEEERKVAKAQKMLIEMLREPLAFAGLYAKKLLGSDLATKSFIMDKPSSDETNPFSPITNDGLQAPYLLNAVLQAHFEVRQRANPGATVQAKYRDKLLMRVHPDLESVLFAPFAAMVAPEKVKFIQTLLAVFRDYAVRNRGAKSSKDVQLTKRKLLRGNADALKDVGLGKLNLKGVKDYFLQKWPYLPKSNTPEMDAKQGFLVRFLSARISFVYVDYALNGELDTVSDHLHMERDAARRELWQGVDGIAAVLFEDSILGRTTELGGGKYAALDEPRFIAALMEWRLSLRPRLLRRFAKDKKQKKKRGGYRIGIVKTLRHDLALGCTFGALDALRQYRMGSTINGAGQLKDDGSLPLPPMPSVDDMYRASLLAHVVMRPALRSGAKTDVGQMAQVLALRSKDGKFDTQHAIASVFAVMTKVNPRSFAPYQRRGGKNAPPYFKDMGQQADQMMRLAVRQTSASMYSELTEVQRWEEAHQQDLERRKAAKRRLQQAKAAAATKEEKRSAALEAFMGGASYIPSAAGGDGATAVQPAQQPAGQRDLEHWPVYAAWTLFMHTVVIPATASQLAQRYEEEAARLAVEGRVTLLLERVLQETERPSEKILSAAKKEATAMLLAAEQQAQKVLRDAGVEEDDDDDDEEEEDDEEEGEDEEEGVGEEEGEEGQESGGKKEAQQDDDDDRAGDEEGEAMRVSGDEEEASDSGEGDEEEAPDSDGGDTSGASASAAEAPQETEAQRAAREQATRIRMEAGIAAEARMLQGREERDKLVLAAWSKYATSEGMQSLEADGPGAASQPGAGGATAPEKEEEEDVADEGDEGEAPVVTMTEIDGRSVLKRQYVLAGLVRAANTPTTTGGLTSEQVKEIVRVGFYGAVGSGSYQDLSDAMSALYGDLPQRWNEARTTFGRTPINATMQTGMLPDSWRVDNAPMPGATPLPDGFKRLVEQAGALRRELHEYGRAVGADVVKQVMAEAQRLLGAQASDRAAEAPWPALDKVDEAVTVDASGEVKLSAELLSAFVSCAGRLAEALWEASNVLRAHVLRASDGCIQRRVWAYADAMSNTQYASAGVQLMQLADPSQRGAVTSGMLNQPELSWAQQEQLVERKDPVAARERRLRLLVLWLRKQSNLFSGMVAPTEYYRQMSDDEFDPWYAMTRWACVLHPDAAELATEERNTALLGVAMVADGQPRLTLWPFDEVVDKDASEAEESHHAASPAPAAAPPEASGAAGAPPSPAQQLVAQAAEAAVTAVEQPSSSAEADSSALVAALRSLREDVLKQARDAGQLDAEQMTVLEQATEKWVVAEQDVREDEDRDDDEDDEDWSGDKDLSFVSADDDATPEGSPQRADAPQPAGTAGDEVEQEGDESAPASGPDDSYASTADEDQTVRVTAFGQPFSLYGLEGDLTYLLWVQSAGDDPQREPGLSGPIAQVAVESEVGFQLAIVDGDNTEQGVPRSLVPPRLLIRPGGPGVGGGGDGDEIEAIATIAVGPVSLMHNYEPPSSNDLGRGAPYDGHVHVGGDGMRWPERPDPAHVPARGVALSLRNNIPDGRDEVGAPLVMLDDLEELEEQDRAAGTDAA